MGHDPAAFFERDGWRKADLRDALDKARVPLSAFETRGMGFKDGAEDVRGFRKSCTDGRVTPLPSPLLRSVRHQNKWDC